MLMSPRGAALVAAVGVASWFGGSTFEKWKSSTLQVNVPIFGTVSAATPIPPNRVSEIMRHGYPSLDNLKVFDDYVLSYDRRNRIPYWVFEHLTKDKLKVTPNVDRSKCEFMEDQTVLEPFRSTNADYLKSGYDRGHLAAAGNHRLEQRHCDQTFYLSNIAPQVGVGFNRHAWNTLEKHTRKLTKKYKNVYVCTGPLFMPRFHSNGKKYITYEVIGKNDVAVPTHFFKVIVMETEDAKFSMEAYVMPNERIEPLENLDLSRYLVSPEVIEKRAGFQLFDRLQKQMFIAINGSTKKY